MPTSAPAALVAGTGFGCRIQLPAMRAAGFDVRGLVGTSAERTQERADANGVPAAFTNLDEAISTTGAVAVAISTPPHTHAALVLQAIARGCHVICEKPFAANAHEARAMHSVAEQAGIVHLVGHEFRWAPERAMLGRIVSEGLIGEPRLANFTSLSPYLLQTGPDMPPWWFDKSAGGGWLGAAGSHLVDWIRDLLGDFRSLSAAVSTFDRDRGDADDTFSFRFSLANGAGGIVQQSAAAWGEPLDIVRIVGTEGAVWLDQGRIRLSDKDGTRTVEILDDLQLPPMPPVSTDPRQESAKWQMLTGIELAPYLCLCNAFRAMIEGRQPKGDVSLPTFADGLASMEVLDAIRLSAREEGVLVSLERSRSSVWEASSGH